MLKFMMRINFIFIVLPFFLMSHTHLSYLLSIEKINKQIRQLEEQLQDSDKEEMREEVKGQGLMIADWKGYSEEVQKIKIKSQKIKSIREKISHLKEQKNDLMNQKGI